MHFDNYNFPPESWRGRSYLRTTNWSLLVAVSNELLSQSFVNCHLSSIQPMVVFFHCICLSGLMIVHPLLTNFIYKFQK